MSKSKRREKQVEDRICQRAREHGGIAYKFTSPGRRSVPDRLMCMPCWNWMPATIKTVEAKRPGEKPTKSQLREHVRIENRGGIVFVLDDYGIVDFTFEVMCDGSCKNGKT